MKRGVDRLRGTLWLSLFPRRLRFEIQLATRHLRSGGKQTLLTISAVAAGVIIVVFVTALIFGLQRRWTTILTDVLPHVTIRIVDPKPTPLATVPGAPSGAISSRIEQSSPQQKNLENWEQVVEIVQALPNVRVVAPVVRGQAFASKGGNPYGVTVVGADPVIQDQVMPVTKNLIAGHYTGLHSEEIVIDYELARDLNVGTGDRIRLTSSTGAIEAFTIAGIYSQGQGRGSAYITLRTAQSLYGLGTAVNVIFVKVVDIFRANEVAARIQSLLPYEARSWIQSSGFRLRHRLDPDRVSPPKIQANRHSQEYGSAPPPDSPGVCLRRAGHRGRGQQCRGGSWYVDRLPTQFDRATGHPCRTTSRAALSGSDLTPLHSHGHAGGDNGHGAGGIATGPPGRPPEPC
jgi:MacB-like periplasmic core domain